MSSLHERIVEKDKDGKITAGVFLPIPKEIAKHFPNKDHEDDSPPHITLLFVGDITPEQQQKLVYRVKKVMRYVKPFRVDMSEYGEFLNKHGQKIPHMKPTATHPNGLAALHVALWRAAEDAGIPISHSYGEYNPGRADASSFKSHATLDYLDGDADYSGPRPSGSWDVDEVEVWGHDKVKVPLRGKGMSEDKLPGGLGDKLKPSDVDPKQLAMGIKVELEHTKDRALAQEIALDHLAEDPRYYTKLKKVHHEDEGLTEAKKKLTAAQERYLVALVKTHVKADKANRARWNEPQEWISEAAVAEAMKKSPTQVAPLGAAVVAAGYAARQTKTTRGSKLILGPFGRWQGGAKSTYSKSSLVKPTKAGKFYVVELLKAQQKKTEDLALDMGARVKSTNEDASLFSRVVLTEMTDAEAELADTIIRAHDEHDHQGEMWREVRTRLHGHPDGIPGVKASLYGRIVEDHPCDGRKMRKPWRTPGEGRKFAVCVQKDGKRKVVRFGDPEMEIKRDDPERRKNFRARHNCDTPGPDDKPRYWSCQGTWHPKKSVSDVVREAREIATRVMEAKKDKLDELIADYERYATIQRMGKSAAIVMTTNQHMAKNVAQAIKKRLRVGSVDIKRERAGFLLTWAPPISAQEWADRGHPHYVLVELDDEYTFMTRPGQEESVDFPSKYGSVRSPSSRSGLGTAPDRDTRPETEAGEEDQAQAAIMKVKALRGKLRRR